MLEHWTCPFEGQAALDKDGSRHVGWARADQAGRGGPASETMLSQDCSLDCRGIQKRRVQCSIT